MRRRSFDRRSFPRPSIARARRSLLRSAVRNDEADELAVQLEEITAEMKELLDNASGILRKVRSLPGGEMIAERAYGYWLPGMRSYLDAEGSHRAMVTMMNTVEELNELADETGLEGRRDFFEADEDEDY